jgi:hypothetical protein
MDTRDPDAPQTPMSSTDARQGQKIGAVRWVLVIGLLLVVVAFIAAYYIA